MKKKKGGKMKKEAPKPHISNEEIKNEKDELSDGKSSYGGLNMANFKKNLGCGS